MKPSVGWALALILTTQLATAAAASRVVAVGDVHGDFDALVSILREAGLIDGANRWSGGNATLVQTGDLLDRGIQVLEVMDLMMSLQKEAAEQGGRVVVLLGNHEAWSFLGDFHDTSSATYAAFAVEESVQRQAEAYRDYERWWKHHGKKLEGSANWFAFQDEEDWLESHPPGFVEYLEAIGPAGRYGQWLRSLPMVAKVGDTIFVHGGINRELASSSLGEINRRARSEILELDRCVPEMIEKKLITRTSRADEMVLVAAAELERLKLRITGGSMADESRGRNQLKNDKKRYQEIFECIADYSEWHLVHEESPVSFRGYAFWSEEEGREWVATLLESWEAERIVVGHTTIADGRIKVRFDGRVFFLDTGLSPAAYAGGRPSALEIQDGIVSAIYLDGATVLWGDSGSSTVSKTASRWLGPGGEPLPFEDDSQVEEFLRTADIVSSEPIFKGINAPLKVLLARGELQGHAVFRSVNQRVLDESRPDRRGRPSYRDSFIFECAAYELDRLLGIYRVPVAVERPYQGKSGSLQIWVEDAVDEKTRRNRRMEPPDPRHWTYQQTVRRIFDALINNWDRNQENQLIDGQWKLHLIDHTRSFAAGANLRDREKITYCDRKLWDKLQTLEPELVTKELEPFLTRAELDALFVRWEKLVGHIRHLIDERGEAAVLIDPPSR